MAAMLYALQDPHTLRPLLKTVSSPRAGAGLILLFHLQGPAWVLTQCCSLTEEQVCAELWPAISSDPPASWLPLPPICWFPPAPCSLNVPVAFSHLEAGYISLCLSVDQLLDIWAVFTLWLLSYEHLCMHLGLNTSFQFHGGLYLVHGLS